MNFSMPAAISSSVMVLPRYGRSAAPAGAISRVATGGMIATHSGR
jgi:hypothetical protein